MSNGYSLALFSIDGSNKLRQWAVNADNEGNRNGILDGKEIQVFQNNIKERCGYSFSFDNITPIEVKTIDVYDEEKGEFIYRTITDIAQKYKASTTNIINWLNPAEAKREGKEYNDVMLNNYTQENGIKIAYMSEEDFKASRESVNSQNDSYLQACENLEGAQEKLKNAGLDEYYTVKLDGDTVVIDIKEGVTRSREKVIENFGFSPENVKREEYKQGNQLRVPLDEFKPVKEKTLLEKLFGL